MASTLTVDNIVGATTAANVKLPAGCILQTLSTTKTDTFANSSSSNQVITGLTVTITPKYATSKILVHASVAASTSSGGRAFITLGKGGSVLVQGDESGSRRRCFAQIQNSDTGFMNSITMEFLDSPATTSALTYQVIGLPEGGSTQININKSSTDSDSASRGRGSSTITVMEIAQ